ncbi:mitochondrial fission ELM1 family protein [Sphingomonas sabuli]|uniref:Mitochondrial fission ELM1 family protein n=1 Tax=Sphingomonas sabuli TaxID=2764186 RepID=A0A7G9L360_9SPHN|nr:ELM1/GtrOC1 family putative glycosyltransferase [Sphingomonas sabuli]QNM83059.1 mitochondrial fission ELM1 family protein [Sphingomonas sabuli]
MTRARIWVLLGEKTGDNNQLLRLAEALGLPFRAIELRYTQLRRLRPALLGESLASLDKESRDEIAPPWPDLVLGIGNRSAPVALAIRKASGGMVKLVRLGNPRLDPRNFDLVITTPQYDVPARSNVIRLPVGISTVTPVKPTSREREWLKALPRPHRLLLVGGDTFMWRLTPAIVAEAAAYLEAIPGTLIGCGSARTDPEALAALNLRKGLPRYSVLLKDADEIHVTADSVAMVSDAIATGKPVGLVLPQQTLAGRFFYGSGLPVPVRDIRRFWTGVQAAGLVGTIDAPRSGKLNCDPLATAVAAVRALL